MFRIVLLVTGLVRILLSQQSLAELYKWVDENGRVHFSDQKHRASKNAQDISASLKDTNVDSSQRSQKQLTDVFNQGRQEQARNQAQAQKAAQKAHQKQCQKMRYKLSRISRRVQYVDSSGKVIPVSENQRKEDVAQTRAWLNKNC